MHDDDTRQLVRLACDGDAEATAQLMQRYRSRLQHMVCVRMDPRMGARVDSSDVIQETLTAACQQLPEYLKAQPIPFYPWLRRIAWQKLMHLHQHHLDAAKRSVKRERQQNWRISDHSAAQLAHLITGSSASPSAAAQREEMYDRVRITLDKLNDQDREVILQRYLEQLSIKEIAATLSATEATIRMRHLRALRRLRRLLDTEDLS